jgi:hypothetical protein
MSARVRAGPMQFHWVNQMHYDALGDYIVEHIQVAFPHHDQFNIAYAHAPPHTRTTHTHTHHRTRTHCCWSSIDGALGGGAAGSRTC